MPEQHDEAVQARIDRHVASEHRNAAEAAEQRTIAQRIRGNRRSLQLTALILTLFLVDFFWSSHTASTAATGQARIQQEAIAAEQKAISAGCDFWYPLTSLPVTTIPPASKPSQLSVQIIAGARESYAGQCGPVHKPLPPPSASFAHWAQVYGVPVALARSTR